MSGRSDIPLVDWESRYQAGATAWERCEPNPAFLAWRAGGLLTPSRILVPCAGRSAEPALLAADGFDVTIVDLAPSAIAVQTQRLVAATPPATLVHSNLFEWEPAAPFDAVYDQTALCALPPALWPDYEERLHRWLVRDGKLLILFMQTARAGGPPYDCAMDEMRRLFPPQRWIWPETLEVPIYHPNNLTEQPVALLRQG
jgi:hypothetical protein